jgi:hypothetical protein
LTQSRRADLIERVKDSYLMPFRAIASAFKLFTRNRKRIREFARRPRVASVLTYGMLITMLLWFAIAALNRGEDDGRLTAALQSLWSKPGGEETAPASLPNERNPGADVLIRDDANLR